MFLYLKLWIWIFIPGLSGEEYRVKKCTRYKYLARGTAFSGVTRHTQYLAVLWCVRVRFVSWVKSSCWHLDFQSHFFTKMQSHAAYFWVKVRIALKPHHETNFSIIELFTFIILLLRKGIKLCTLDRLDKCLAYNAFFILYGLAIVDPPNTWEVYFVNSLIMAVAFFSFSAFYFDRNIILYWLDVIVAVFCITSVSSL